MTALAGTQPTVTQVIMDIDLNPAGRLSAVLHKLKKQSSHVKVHAAIAQVFELSPNDNMAILRKLADLIELAIEAKEAVKARVQGDQSLHLKPFSSIEAFLGLASSNANMGNLNPYLDDMTLYGLGICTHALQPYYSVLSIEEKLVLDLLEALDKLLEDCVQSHLPESLKIFFKNNLEALREALWALRISGPLNLQDEIDRIIGAMARNSGEIRQAAEDEENKSIIERLFSLIGKINDSTQFVQNGVLLAGAVSPLLLSFCK